MGLVWSSSVVPKEREKEQEEEIEEEPIVFPSLAWTDTGTLTEHLDCWLSSEEAELPLAYLKDHKQTPSEKVKELVLHALKNQPLHEDERIIAEAIIMVVGRPALLVVDDGFRPPSSGEWAEELSRHHARISSVLPAVGRIELTNHPRYEEVGTGWLVRPGVVVTNRHVAVEFATKRLGGGYEFRQHTGRRISARIDFRQEYQQRSPSKSYDIIEVLHVEDDEGPDIALLRIGVRDDDPEPILLAEVDHIRKLHGEEVAVIGYPSHDPRNDPEVMHQIFGGISGVKRLAPGKIGCAYEKESVFTHDCSTLGGNSGSPVINLATGAAVGLHYGGRYRKANYAVSVAVIQDRVEKYATL